jgi:hypothetical protein
MSCADISIILHQILAYTNPKWFLYSPIQTAILAGLQMNDTYIDTYNPMFEVMQELNNR